MYKILVQALHAGSGATTVAFNLAQALSTRERGTLVSLRPEHGQIMASCHHSVLDVAQPSAHEAMVISPSLQLYCALTWLKARESWESLWDYLNFHLSGFVVIDGGPSSSELCARAAFEADIILTVITPNAAGLMALRGYHTDKREFIVGNQLQPQSALQADLMLMVRAHQQVCPVQLSYDEHVLRAILDNQLLSAAYPQCAFVSEMDSLAVFCELLKIKYKLDLPDLVSRSSLELESRDQSDAADQAVPPIVGSTVLYDAAADNAQARTVSGTESTVESAASGAGAADTKDSAVSPVSKMDGRTAGAENSGADTVGTVSEGKGVAALAAETLVLERRM